MSTLEATSGALPRSSNRTVIVAWTIAVLTLAFFLIEHQNTRISSLETFTLTGDEMAERAAEGDLGRRIAFPMIALWGVLLLMRRDGAPLQIQSPLGWLLVAYLSWCGLSILWSENPALTVRHFSVLALCSVGALGIARQMTMRELCVITLAVTSILIANDVRTEIALGTFAPFSHDYRFSGTLHPNSQAPNCATMALAAGVLATRAKRGRILLWGLCLCGVGLLLLTKSRTVTAAFLVGLLVYHSYGATWRWRVAVWTSLLWAGCALVLAASLLGGGIEQRISNVVLLGRQEETDSLSGRIPIWSQLLPYIDESLWFGHGYQTFWTPQRIESFSREFQATVPDGHSAYLDTALELGLVGGLLCAVTALSGIRLAARRYLTSRDFGYGFFFALLTYRTLNALLESGFVLPTSFVPFTMFCGFAHLGFCADPFARVAEESQEGSP